jgi:predicted nucleotidyltransferase
MGRGLVGKFKKLGVSIIYLFGSRATGKGSILSDVDIGIVLRDLSSSDTSTLYHSFYQLFAEIYPASKIDIVFLQRAPLSLQYFAVKEGKILYEEDRRVTADYEYLVMNHYLDFRPVLDFFDRVTMEKYAKA